MRIYLAAPYAMRDQLREFSAMLERDGHECTATWLQATRPVDKTTIGTSPATSDEDVKRHVEQDIEDVSRSDLLVLFTVPFGRHQFPNLAELLEQSGSSGGRHVETGIALALGIPIIVVGEPENIFHRTMHNTRSWRETFSQIEAIASSRFRSN